MEIIIFLGVITLQEVRVAKMQELRQAQEEKASLQEQLQETLATLADSRHASQQALQSVQADKQFVAG